MAKSTTPKAILDALFPDAVTVAGLRLQPFTSLHYLALERINSPLVGESAADPVCEDLLAALLILSSTPKTLREMLGFGQPLFGQLTLDLAERVPINQLPGIIPLLKAHINTAFAPAVPTAAPDGEVRPLAPASSSDPSTP
jgi:hypothetical protein